MTDIIETKIQNKSIYIVAMPIGNPEDITLRALKILKEVDFIACEDTRKTDKLLKYHNISASLFCYNDFSDDKDRKKIFRILDENKSIALVSDAGTPLISDPGFKLINEARQKNYQISSIPGPCSIICSLTLSALPTDRFYFEGFLPAKKGMRINRLDDIKDLNTVIIFFETARRLSSMLNDLLEVFGANKKCSIIREMTKKFEETKTDSLENLCKYYQNNEVKGEIVVILDAKIDSSDITDQLLIEQLKLAINDMSLKDAVKFVSENNKVKKKRVYDLALNVNC